LASIYAVMTWDFLDLSAAAWTGSMVDVAVEAAARLTVVLPAGWRNPGTTPSPTSALPPSEVVKKSALPSPIYCILPAL
jgi:hypothetical protein